MLHRSFKPAKCKTSLKLAVSRIKLLRNKRAAQVTQLKRELAKLIESGQDRTARIRVEHVVREEKTIAAYDLIEIYCELVAARLPIIESQKNCPIDLKEAITSIIFASPRCADLPELLDIRKHFTAKYGKEFMSSALELRPNCGVNRMLVEKLSAVAPDGQTKMKILKTIAEEHNIKWDPTSFEEGELQTPDDLLNGPNTFDNSSKMHAEPPHIQAPLSQDLKHDVPEDLYAHNARSSTSLQNVVSADINSNKNMSSASFHPEVKSGKGPEEMELRHVPSLDKNIFSADRQNWNMEFKDATAAAQAAAESAERASMAARAAAELSSHGRIDRPYSGESNRSSPYGSSEPGPQQFTSTNLTGDGFPKDLPNSSFHVRNPRVRHNERTFGNEPDNMSGVADRFYRDDGTTRVASVESNEVSMDEGILRHNLQKGDRCTQRSSFEADSMKPERGSSFDEVNGNKQFSKSEVEYASKSQDGMKTEYIDYIAEDRNRKESSTVPTYSNDFALNSKWSNQGYDNDSDNDFSDGIHQGDFQKDTKQSSAYDNAPVVFDDSASDEDEHKFDLEDAHGRRDSHLYFPSPDRKSPNHYSENTNAWRSTKGEAEPVDPPSWSHLPTESHSTSELSEGLRNSVVNSQPEDLLPMTFDDSDDPSSDSEKDLDNSKPIRDLDKSARPSEQSVYADNSVLTQRSHRFTGSSAKEMGRVESEGKSSFDGIPTSHSSFKWAKPQSNSDDVQHEPFDKLSSRLSLRHERKDKDMDHPTESPDIAQNIALPDGEGKELNFGTLTGGLRNKGYIRPPYVKSSSNDGSPLSNSRQRFKDTPNSSEQFTSSPSGKTYQESNNRKVSPQVNRKTSSRAPVTYSDSSSDDSEEELPKQPLARNQESYSKKEHLKVNKKPISRAPITFFDSDSGDSEVDLRKQTSANKVRSGSKYSRRTKASSPSRSGSSYSKVAAVPEVSVATDYSSVRETPSERRPSMSSIATDSPKHQSKDISSGHHGSSKSLSESKIFLHEEGSYPPQKEQSSHSLPKASHVGTPSGEISKTASHVHPKLPDFDTLSAQLDSLRLNRK